MIPILYEPEEKNFSTNGLGLLSDALSAEVTEERNGVYQLHMVYPVDGIHFAEIQDMSVIRAVPADGKQAQPFDVFRISTPIDGKVEIDARHASYRLSKNTVMPFKSTAVADALSKIKNNVVEDCDFDFWTDKVSSGTMDLKAPQSVRAILGGVQGSILDSFGGGEYEWDNFTVKLWKDRGTDRGVTLRYGKNITDIKQERNIENTVTGIVPFWAGTDDEQNDILVTLDEKAVYSANAGDFPYARTVPVDFSGDFQNKPTQEQLRSRAQAYITANKVGQPGISIDVSFIPLWQTEEYKDIANLERVNLCDTVTVEFPKLHISVKAKVVKTVYDVLKERYSKVELGDAKTNLASQISQKVDNAVSGIRKEIPKTSQFVKILNEQTALITGGLGGYVKFIYNADGQPQELLFMDTDDIQTAVNVIRINKNGIGFSNNGYEPSSFRSAWTIDGKFSADFISTGHMLANFIEGGTLSMGGEDNGHGVIKVYNGDGELIGEWNKDGLMASGDLQMTKEKLRSGLGTANKFWYNVVDASTRHDEASGFYSRKSDNNGKVVSGYAFFPGDTELIEQVLTPDKWGKTFVFSTDELNKGIVAFLEMWTSGISFSHHAYGDEAECNLPEFEITGTKFDLSGGGFFVQNSGGKTTITGTGGTLELSETNYSKTAEIRTSKTLMRTKYTGNDNEIFIKTDANASDKYKCSFYMRATQNKTQEEIELNAGDVRFEVRSTGGEINGNHIAYESSSSRRYKHDINYELTGKRVSENILKLPVAEFVFNADHNLQYEDMRGQKIPGIIAEDVAKIYPSAAIYKNGLVESWDERRIIPAMLDVIQKQDKKIQQLEERLKKIEELLT